MIALKGSAADWLGTPGTCWEWQRSSSSWVAYQQQEHLSGRSFFLAPSRAFLNRRPAHPLFDDIVLEIA